jgi:phenylacetate-CoA ligase
MDLKKLLYKNKRLLSFILENINPETLISLGKRKAFKTFQDTANEVEAYKTVLKNNGIDPSTIHSANDFHKIPILDKQNYISKYPLTTLLHSPIEYNYTIEESSGFSGKSSFWPRFDGQDDLFTDYMELGLIKTFHIDQKSTLLINTFALGTWVTGFKFGRGALTISNKKGNKLTVINTGIKKESVYKYLETFEKYYEQIILAGYPPFIKEIVEQSINNGLIPDKTKINIITGGESFPEEWRDYISGLLNIKVLDFNQKILSAYGAADVGLELGYEQPITILFRKLLISNQNLRQRILKTTQNSVPHFFQYNPLNVFVETSNDELIFTANSGIPQVRYNLHDSGGIISFNEMLECLSLKYSKKLILSNFKPFKLPVLYLLGRTDGVIAVSSANVYIEQIKAIVNSMELQPYITGKFFAFNRMDSQFKPELHICLETNEVSEKAKLFIEETITSKLCLSNQDYKEFYTSDRAQYRPHFDYLSKVEFSQYTEDSIKIKYLKK